MPSINGVPQFGSNPAQRDFEKKLQTLSTQNPELIRDRKTLAYLALAAPKKSDGTDYTPQEISKSMNQAYWTAKTQKSLFGNISSFFGKVASQATQYARNVDPTSGNTWSALGHSIGGFASGLNEHANGLASWGVNKVKGVFNPNNWNVSELAARSETEKERAARLNRSTVSQLVTTAWDPVNKAATFIGEEAQMVPNTAGYFMSLVNTKGLGYALGAVTPAVLAGIMSDGVISGAIGKELTAAEISSTEEAILANRTAGVIRNDEKYIESLKGKHNITTEQMIEAAAANRRLTILKPSAVYEKTIKRLEASQSSWDQHLAAEMRDRLKIAAEEESASSFGGRSFKREGVKGASKLDSVLDAKSGFFGRVFGATYKRIHQGNLFLGRPSAQIAYNLTAAMAEETDPELWQKTKMGAVVMPDGHMSTVGDEIARMLQLDHGFFHTAIADLVNVDLNFAVDDPLTRMLRIRDQAKSAYGFTGTLGKYFGGMAIRHPGDVRRAYFQYKSVRRAIDWIAEHSGAEILQTFKYVFNTKLANDLGHAKNSEEVMSILEDVNQGIEMVFARMPTMGWYSLFKTRLKGDLGEKYGFLGRLLEQDMIITTRVADEVMAELGLDIRPKSFTYAKLNPAGKARVLSRQQMRNYMRNGAKRVSHQFMERQRWYNVRTGAETTNRVEVGDSYAIPSIMGVLQRSNVPALTARAYGDQLLGLAARGDHFGYKRAFRNMMYETLLRELMAKVPQAEYEWFVKSNEDFLWKKVDSMIGHDGGGGTGVYVADDLMTLNRTIDPVTGQIGSSGIGSTHQGALWLPDEREIKRVQRQLSELVTSLQSHETLTSLLATDDTLVTLTNIAEHSNMTVHATLTHLKKVYKNVIEKGPDFFENTEIYRGYRRAYKYHLDRYEKMLLGDTSKQLTRVQRIVNVLDDLQKLRFKLDEQINRETLGIEPRMSTAPGAVRTETEEANLYTGVSEIDRANETERWANVQQMQGEYNALTEMQIELRARFNMAPDSDKTIEQLAKETADAQGMLGKKRDEFAEAFMERYHKRANGRGLGTGKRNLRSNRELVSDFFQFYVNNRYFKPMTLSSPAWATRVSISETLLNSMRIGGMNFFEAHVASSIAKHEFKLGQSYQLDKAERKLFFNALGSTMLGFEKGILEGLQSPQLERLLDDAATLFLLHDGHLPLGVQHNDDTLNESALHDGMIEQMIGLDGDVGSAGVKKGWYKRGAFGRVDGNSPSGGSAMVESMRRVYQDKVMGPVARAAAHIVRQRGMEAFDAAADEIMPRLIREALADLEKNPAFVRRNEILAQKREDLMNKEEFRNANFMEQERLIANMESEILSVEDIVSEMVPKSMRDHFEANGRGISQLEDARKEILTKIDEAQKEVDRLRGVAFGDDAKQIQKGLVADAKAELKDISKQLSDLRAEQKELIKLQEEHPYTPLVRQLEGKSSTAPYKSVREDLIMGLGDNIKETLASLDGRIDELFDGKKIVIPRGGYAEMSRDRFMTFTDAEGNVVPNAELYQGIFEKYPELWSDNERYGSHFKLGMPGIEGYDALSHILGLEPSMFAQFPRETGREDFIAAYETWSKVLANKKLTKHFASGALKEQGEKWMRRNVSARPADWKLDAAQVWERRLALTSPKAPTHGLNPEDWFREAMMVVDARRAMAEAAGHLKTRKFTDAYKALTDIDPTMTGKLKASSAWDVSNDTAFAVRGVPIEKILGPGLSEEKALAELAFHIRQNSSLEESRVFDPRFSPNYTPDEAGRIKFFEDFEMHAQARKDLEKAERTAQDEIALEKRYEASQRQRLIDQAETLKKRFSTASEGGLVEKEKAAQVFPELEPELAILIKRLNGDFAKIRDLKLGDHIAISLPTTVEGATPETVQRALKEFLPSGYELSYIQADGLIGPIPTDTVAINYATAGHLYSEMIRKGVSDWNNVAYSSLMSRLGIGRKELRKILDGAEGSLVEESSSFRRVTAVAGHENKPFQTEYVADGIKDLFDSGIGEELMQGMKDSLAGWMDHLRTLEINIPGLSTEGLTPAGAFGKMETIYGNITHTADGKLFGATRTPRAGQADADIAKDLNKIFKDARFRIEGKPWTAKKVRDYRSAVEDYVQELFRSDAGQKFLAAQEQIAMNTSFAMSRSEVDAQSILMGGGVIPIEFIFPQQYGLTPEIMQHIAAEMGSTNAVRMSEGVPTFVYQDVDRHGDKLPSAGEIMAKGGFEASMLSHILIYRQIFNSLTSHGDHMIKAMERARISRAEIDQIMKPKYDEVTQRPRRNGTPPKAVDAMLGDPKNEDVIRQLRASFNQRTMRNVFGVQKLDPIMASSYVQRLQSKIDGSAKFVKAKLSFKDGHIKIDGFSYDPTSAAGRRKAVETLKTICETADTHRLPIKISVPTVGDASISELEKRITAYFGSFGFNAQRGETFTGAYRDLELTRDPVKPGSSALIDEDAVQDAFVPQKAKAVKPAETLTEPVKPEFVPRPKNLEDPPQKPYDWEYETKADFRDAMSDYKAEMKDWRAGFEKLSPKDREAAKAFADYLDAYEKYDVDIDAYDLQQAGGYEPRTFQTTVPEEIAKRGENAERWIKTFVEGTGVTYPTAKRVWDRAKDMDRVRLARENDREGFYALKAKIKENSAKQVEVGRKMAKVNKKLTSVPSADVIAEPFQQEYVKQSDRLTRLLEESAGKDERLDRAYARRDKMRGHVARQSEKAIERSAKRAVQFYGRRLRNDEVGKAKLVRGIVNRTGTINTQIERLVSQKIDREIMKLGGASVSGDGYKAFQQEIADYAYAHLGSMDERELTRYDRYKKLIADQDLSSGDWQTDWAYVLSVNMMGLASSKETKEVFPDLLRQMDTGDIMSSRKAAQWLQKRVNSKKGYPGPFPERQPLSIYDRGIGSVINNVSERMHQYVLDPFVNEMVREPLFVWEYHVQMERLRPSISAGIMTEDQAQVAAQIAASVNMKKFVHNPHDKLVWENNWRVVAPYYFAKNQAMRRAFRMAGDNAAAFEKYLKINLAVTEFVAQSVENSTTYNVPGSEVVASLTNSLVGGFLVGSGYSNMGKTVNNFGFDASPSSITSIVITGMKPGARGILREMVQIPFGMNFTVPAKFIYERFFDSSAYAHNILVDLIGETSARTSAFEDLNPNSFLRNAWRGTFGGAWNQDHPGSYQSQELWVMNDILDQITYKFYQKAQKLYPQLNSTQLAQYGSKEALWQYYAVDEANKYFNKEDNWQQIQNQANGQTALMWTLKTIGSYTLPVAINIGDRFYNRQDFYDLQHEKDAQGELKYPTLQLASNEYMRRHPDKMWAIMPHTLSTGNSYPETVAGTKFIEHNEQLVRQFKLASAFFVPRNKRETAFDSRALMLQYSNKLRVKESPFDFHVQAMVQMGDRHYSQLELKYRMDLSNVDLATKEGAEYAQAYIKARTDEERYQVAISRLGTSAPLTLNAYNTLEKEALAYGTKDNDLWRQFGGHFTKSKKSLAYRSYNEMVQALDDPKIHQALPQYQIEGYKSLIEQYKTYTAEFKQYKDARVSTSEVKNRWYSYCKAVANDPAYADYSGFILSVLAKMPDPY